ncbi:PleD family two-component system response regulator [Leptothoe sp. PORK10 BA2]|uniref:PleD family two-component system response regulator n=1 Tax=Leptothoe sp. PORK10 BA2 TaxID=3110254 RepID=UPI002B21E40F|nr:PleD family two-component system response regulator [Leptothoe sp. PORK10 BA2]MEA5467053.1 PleD family two-component system response regulator [Leptothoe sp. PORK10 BA2]
MDGSLDVSPASERVPLILIVDDDPISNLMLSEILRKDGYQTLVVGDGQAALDICQKELPDIILMDAVMPVMNGFDCCRSIHIWYGDSCPPILMITGLNDTESVERAYQAGAIDYVTKPFHWAVLRGRVRQAISANLAHQKLKQALGKERLLLQELKIANHKLHQLASTDGLTSIANRRVFDERLESEWKRLCREQSPLGLILIDIDCFKAYNDTYGHLNGDKCLCQVANIIHTCVRRPADVAARYGGEEFALILPNTDLEGVICVGKAVQKELQKLAIPHASSIVKPFVTVSIGVVAVLPTLSSSPQTLISWADQALYDAKNNGRNCVVAFTSSVING